MSTVEHDPSVLVEVAADYLHEEPPPLGDGQLLLDRFEHATRCLPSAWRNRLFGALPRSYQRRGWDQLGAASERLIELELERSWSL